MREIVLDTETTGLDPTNGDRIVEIGCLELVNRLPTGKTYHVYINPERDMPREAEAVHGLSAAFLADKPVFAEIAEEFIAFVKGAALIIHNAPFDVGFLDFELGRTKSGNQNLAQFCDVLDTLVLAREKHAGQRNNLDALCKRYEVNNAHRTLHGALLDAEILADVYLVMTGGQVNLNINDQSDSEQGALNKTSTVRCLPADRAPLKVIKASESELASHNKKLEAIKSASGRCVWQDLSQ